RACRLRSILPALPSDDTLLAHLNQFVQNVHIAQRPDQFTIVVPEELAAWYRDRLSESTMDGWIAHEGEVAVGFVLGTHHPRPSTPFSPERDWYEIDQLAVDPAHRRRGVGAALMLHALADARARGYRSIELSVWAFNDDMQRLIHRLGFVAKVGRFELRVDA